MAGLKKAKFIPENGKSIDVLFNPGEYTITKTNGYNEIPNRVTPLAQFKSVSIDVLNVKLFFDTYVKERGKDVRDYTDQIVKLMDKDEKIWSPPLCKFVWDTEVFTGYITNIVQKFTMFLSTGIPVRAELTVTIKSFKLKGINKKFKQSSDFSNTNIRKLKQGEQLSTIAATEYGDPGKWRSIAKANQIDNPRLVEPGSELVLPPWWDES